MTRTENRRQIDRAAKKKYLGVPLNRYKQAVRTLVFSAVECGILVRPASCDECGNTATLEGHHEDYCQPLVVEWLCNDCHSARHKKTHCRRGHEYTEENTYSPVNGGRVCRPCAAMRARRRTALRSGRPLASAETQLAKARSLLLEKVK